nr:efflux RND transporter periplasmic adaptor subunit [Paraurantiacibacter namhicola]
MNLESGTGTTAGEDPLEAERKRAGKRRLFLFIAIGLIAILAAGYVWNAMAGEEEEAPPEQTAAVTVVSPGAGTIEGMISATGTLAARREIPVGVVGEGGRVVSVPVEEGQWVRAGQVLAVIDRSVQNRQLESAAAQIEVAQSDANLAQANLDRALQLVDRGFISQADVDRLTATRDAAVARVKVARASYGELQARNARLNIVAPAAGLLLTRNVEPGQVVSGGSGVLFMIARGGEMELMAEVGEQELSRLSVGVPATVVPVGTDKVFEGQVWQIAPTIDAQNRQGTARVALPYAPELRPGGFATATIRSGTVTAPMLPESAIQSDDGSSYVLVVDGENRVRRRPVKLGMVTDNGIAISSGLDGTERVIVRAGAFVKEGEEVRPIVAKEG